MAKKELLSKLNLKDYNNELEVILEKKDFSSQVKNLLLSMFYKLETNYKDYAIVKQDVSSKEAFIEALMNIIKTKCKQIELIKPKEEETVKFSVYPEDGKIVCYQNEVVLLHAILKLSEKEFFMPEEYNAFKRAIQKILIAGYELDVKELLTNFDGWAWNNNLDKVDDIDSYLIYQNLRILMGNNFLHEWKCDRRKKDYLSDIKQFSEEFWRVFCTFSIMKAEQDKYERKFIQDELIKIKEELSKMHNKNDFLKEIYERKRGASERIKLLDKILNDNDLMKEEFLSRNAKLPLEDKIFSISHLEERIQKERSECMEKMQECNSILEPKNYIEKVKKLEEKIELIEGATSEKNEKQELINLQKLFLQRLKQKIENTVTKKEIIELIYEYRYYLYLPITIDGKITLLKEVSELKKEINDMAKKIITKACKLKALIIINQDISYNFQIMQKILDSKIIYLEDIYVNFTKTDEIHIEVYDSEILDRTEIVKKEKEKDFAIKFNKKIKLFV